MLQMSLKKILTLSLVSFCMCSFTMAATQTTAVNFEDPSTSAPTCFIALGEIDAPEMPGEAPSENPGAPGQPRTPTPEEIGPELQIVPVTPDTEPQHTRVPLPVPPDHSPVWRWPGSTPRRPSQN